MVGLGFFSYKTPFSLAIWAKREKDCGHMIG